MRSADYDLMVKAQNNCCSICKNKAPEGERLHIDHDHETGEVRGLLCMQCNTLLGKAYDNPEVLCAAASYIENGGDPSRFYIETGRLCSSRNH